MKKKKTEKLSQKKIKYIHRNDDFQNILGIIKRRKKQSKNKYKVKIKSKYM